MPSDSKRSKKYRRDNDGEAGTHTRRNDPGLGGWVSAIEGMGKAERQREQEWRDANPPDKEITMQIDGEEVVIGFWRDGDGVYYGQKYKNGYNQHGRTYLDRRLVEAAFSLVEGG